MVAKPPNSDAEPASRFENCSPSLAIIETTMLETPTTMPAITGVKKEIWDFIEEITSANKSISLSFTFFILSTYVEIVIRDFATTFGPFFAP